VTLTELPAHGRKVEELVFVQVSFGDKQVWIDEGMLQLAEPEVAVRAVGRKSPRKALK